MKKWREVIAGILDGTLHIGARTPVLGVPAWATLEVAHGGFATGELVAGGPLRPHERALASLIGFTTRGALNAHFLTDAGRAELLEMLASGCFRVEVPEEGALLAVAWMIAHDANDGAIAILEAIAPFFERLRFYPVPHERPLVAGTTVHRETVGEVADSLRATKDQAQVLAMNETLVVWTPLYDRAVALVLETVIDGDAGRAFPPGWAMRAEELLAEYTEKRASHTLSAMPDQPQGGFSSLRRYLRSMLDDASSLTPGHRVHLRRVLDAIVAKRGAPGSAKLAALRAAQAADAARPLHRDLRLRVLERLAAYPKDAGLPSLDGVTDGALPERITRKLERALEAPVEELVERGVITSGEVLGLVLPQLTSHIRAAGIADAELRRLHAAVYAAFRKRRSLLLLDLAKQVQLEELPWVAAMSPFRRADTRAAAVAKETLVDVSLLALTSFPQTIVPNKLLQELRALAKSATIDVPLVDELAADIFMGKFSDKFVRAARVAAKLLQGSLYERYYGIAFADVLAIDKADFAALCTERAALDSRSPWSVARNGKVIEQEQILTTHNLAALVAGLSLGPRLHGSADVLARRCFTWIVRAQAQDRGRRRPQLRMVKNAAYAWRQMLFFLSVADGSGDAFVAWAHDQLGTMNTRVGSRLQPALAGLRHVMAGGSFDASGHAPNGGRRFLGWTTEPHWLTSSPARPGSP